MSRSTWSRLLQRPGITSGLTVLGVLLCCIGLLSLAAYHSTAALTALQQGHFSQAKQISSQAKPIVTVAHFATGGLIPDLAVWYTALTLPQEISNLVNTATITAESSLSGNDSASVAALLPPLDSLKKKLELISQKLPHTQIIKKKIPDTSQTHLIQAIQGIEDAEKIIDAVSDEEQTWVIILQNSEELRATGGFPGSYVLLNFNTGILTEMVVEDIYDADGQFKGYIAAPAGIKEYTSGENGLRLPDANWWPDFPKSAQTMLQFFALGEKKNIAGLIAINLDTARSILEVTGPLWLPDYDIEVTADNIGEVLRAERSEFFPGSSQKKHLLSLTLVQLKQKISELTPEQQLQLASTLRNSIIQKEVQFYSTSPDIQEIFSKYEIAGKLSSSIEHQEPPCECEPVVLALTESNVGINKVNRYVSRSTEVNFRSDTVTVTTQFANQAAPLSSTELSSLLDQPAETQPRNGNGYLNYYRLIISPHYSVSTIQIGNTQLESWDEEIIKTASGEEFLQIGILVAVPERSTTPVTFELTTASTATPPAVKIIKQSGLPVTPYTITTPGGSQQIQLVSDQVILL